MSADEKFWTVMAWAMLLLFVVAAMRGADTVSAVYLVGMLVAIHGGEAAQERARVGA